jgi:hypothetical protein
MFKSWVEGMKMKLNQTNYAIFVFIVLSEKMIKKILETKTKSDIGGNRY